MTERASLVGQFVRSITIRHSSGTYLLNRSFLDEVAKRNCFAEFEGIDGRHFAQTILDGCAVKDGTTKEMEEAVKRARYAVAYVRGRPESARLTNPDDWDRLYSAAKRAAQALLHVGHFELAKLYKLTCDWYWGDFENEVERAAN